MLLVNSFDTIMVGAGMPLLADSIKIGIAPAPVTEAIRLIESMTDEDAELRGRHLSDESFREALRERRLKRMCG
jgi:hypothetical protein